MHTELCLLRIHIGSHGGPWEPENVKQVTGVDISGKLLAIAEQRKAKRKLDNVEFLQTSLFGERFKLDSFDVVMAFYVLHFFGNIDTVFKRIYDLLKPNG